MRKNYFRSTDAFRRDYQRYEMTKISGRKYFMSSSGWELCILNNGLDDRGKYSKKIKKDYDMIRKFLKVMEKHSVYKKSVCIDRE